MSEDRDGLRYSRPAGLSNAAVYRITDGTPIEAKLAQLNKMEGEGAGRTIEGLLTGSARCLLACRLV